MRVKRATRHASSKSPLDQSTPHLIAEGPARRSTSARRYPSGSDSTRNGGAAAPPVGRIAVAQPRAARHLTYSLSDALFGAWHRTSAAQQFATLFGVIDLKR
jgi:hypothetical protein